ncbi:Oidioi.mRNA.OKI2018_I69.chr2.g5573.t1.cds [Oikopleura dioica]|uniref:Choline O-acetyltransferase n=1 Tax=Oikopleura dioica TaxID=34765 RepID=A0ABN7T523_OIKDI|nr:Oidioi.mRNA.OKI2018_I69.chr2.g5573.t1.cds [Oikopleura dioica]
MRNGIFYKPSINDLEAQIFGIVTKSTPQKNTGILTTCTRREWAILKNKLEQISSTNGSLLKLIQNAAFVVNLDQAGDDSPIEQFLHGGKFATNRWFDCTLQLIINDDGDFGICYEHSVCEGIPVVQLAAEIKRAIIQNPTKEKYYYGNSPLEPLSFRTSHELDLLVSRQIENHRVQQERLDLNVFKFEKFGKTFIKKQNMSPDAFLQVALQCAYHRIYCRLPCSYESGSIRRFRDGRVDNIRASTIPALQLCRHLSEFYSRGDCKSSLSTNSMDYLRKAVRFQTSITQQAITGKGLDNHLLALLNTLKEVSLPIPELFTDNSFKTFNHFELSTSQIPTISRDIYMCYGPVVPDGYGCSYNPQKDCIVFCISSYKDCDATSSERFRRALAESLETLMDICNQFNSKRSNSADKEDIRKDVFGKTPRRVRCNSQVDDLDQLALETRRSTFKRAQTEDKFRL